MVIPTARPNEAPIAIAGINIPAGIRNPKVNIYLLSSSFSSKHDTFKQSIEDNEIVSMHHLWILQERGGWQKQQEDLVCFGQPVILHTTEIDRLKDILQKEQLLFLTKC